MGTGVIEHWVPDSKRPDSVRQGSRAGGQQPDGEAWLPEVDEWFDRTVSMRARRWTAVICAIVLAIIAGTYAADVGLSEIETWGAAAAGALVGLLLLPLLILAVKLVLLCLMLATVAAILWGLYLLFVG